ncbi:type IV conjugative transfer system protein TraE [Pseudoalteromonas luteoviolacea]|uniref:type IV conjugative transfer system protein TraE n=1 Tax=Pseudoalteromonas luteoviolacea TaxID=43657 RepID=UPI001B395337|nr:type IV conjugative transfer system protein TraE [Pseudoalteromonas luteoviolacea]
MDKKKYTSTVINANYKATLWMGVSAVLLASNVMLSSFVMTADTSEKTIVVPPQMDKPFSVQGNEASPEYIEQMARYFSQLLLTYHKKNAQSQFDTILHYTDPSVYSEMKTRFSLDYDRISRNDISSVFYLMGIHIKKNVAVITGELNGFIGSHLVSKKQKTYELRFNYNGNLSITGFNELQKDSVGSYEIIKPDEEVMIEQGELESSNIPGSLNNGVENNGQ